MLFGSNFSDIGLGGYLLLSGFRLWTESEDNWLLSRTGNRTRTYFTRIKPIHGK